jgi:hypothetical protein
MDKSIFKERVTRLQEINKIIEKLDPSIREQSFSLLKAYVTGGFGTERDKEEQDDNAHHAPADAEAFFLKFTHDKPADNACLLAAFHYSQYGTAPFSVDEMKTMAGDVGVTIPDRIDMTYLAAKRDGKNLFSRAGIGKFKTTVYGESYFKKTYNVSKGKKTKLSKDI